MLIVAPQADPATEATLSGHPNGDGTVTIHLTVKTTGGDDIDLTLVAPIDDAGRLIRK